MENSIHIICFVKNGIHFIKKFIDYHAKIADKITFIDNGSTDGTLEIIKEYKDIEILYCEDFKQKGNACTQVMLNSSCDLLVPLDIDELIIYDDGKSIHNDCEKIKQYLQNIHLDGSKYRIKYSYLAHPDNDNWYHISYQPKIIFPKKTFLYTDIGFHRGRTTLDKDSNFNDPCWWRPFFNNNFLNDSVKHINISHIHYHFKSKEIWLHNTKMKLESRVGDKINDKIFLKNYNGEGIHAAKEYLEFINTGKWHDLLKQKKINLEF